MSPRISDDRPNSPSTSGLSGFSDLTAIIDEFLRDIAYQGSANTADKYRYHLRTAFLGWLADSAPEVTRIYDLTPVHLRAFLMDEHERVAPATVAQHYGTLRRFGNWCVDLGYLEHSPANARLVRPPAVPESARMAFAPDEARRLVQYAGRKRRAFIAARDTAIVTTLLGAGLRASELTGMNAEGSIDWGNRAILVTGKGDRDRRVPMGDKVAAALRRYMLARERYVAGLRTRNRRRNQSPPLNSFWITERLTRLTHPTLDAIVKSVAERAGVADVHAHRFRHTAAVEFYRQHRDIMATMHFLGHRRVTVTQGYLRRLGIEYATEARLATPDTWLA